ncbi:MAG: DUF1289 domain-containing protein [Phycisphaerae bacterium]|nr:DUF1289 domain-containing protein [Gemmatimonadaceae bacterium]
MPSPSGPPDSPVPTTPTTESPCVKICLLDLDNMCRGCGRTLDEVARWSTMTLAERIAVNQRLRFTGRPR